MFCLCSPNSYLAADSNVDAAKIIAKKGDTMSLKTAANLAKMTGESSLCHSLSLRCAREHVQSLDWLAAQDILGLQDTLLVSFQFDTAIDKS